MYGNFGTVPQRNTQRFCSRFCVVVSGQLGAHFGSRFSVVVTVQFVLNNNNFLYIECSEETRNGKEDCLKCVLPDPCRQYAEESVQEILSPDT